VTRLEVLGRLRNENDEPLVVLPWWRTAFEALECHAREAQTPTGNAPMAL
jgi:hypothetical protein